ncbi:hypothetical protein VTO73DRAFT_2562 [Trametes versicolor]
MQRLHEELRLAIEMKTIPRRFLQRLRNARTVYSNLAELLEEYAKQSMPNEHKVYFNLAELFSGAYARLL